MTRNSFFSLYTNERRNIYVALEDMDLKWSAEEIHNVIELWNYGMSITYMERQLKRGTDEIALLIVFLAERYRGYIYQRDRGVFSSEEITFDNSTLYWKKINRFIDKLPENYPNGFEVFIDYDKVDFIWDEEEVLQFDLMWKQGYSFQWISKTLRRNYLDCAILLFDRARKDFIFPRKDGLNGKEGEKGKQKVG